MRDPERDTALHAERELAKFTIIKAIVVSNKYEFGFFDRRAQIETRVLCCKPFVHFRVRKEKDVLDLAFVNRIEREVQRRDDRIISQRKPHDLEAVFVKDRRLARVVAQVIDRHALSDAIDRFDRTRVWAATQIESSV